MTQLSLIKDCLFALVQTILKFEKALTETYHLDNNPYKQQKSFPRKGIVQWNNETFDYRFHGAGCSFIHNEIDVHYDYEITSENYISLANWKFSQFVSGWLKKFEQPDISPVEIDHAMYKLYKEGIFKKPYSDYGRYLVDFSWYTTHFG